MNGLSAAGLAGLAGVTEAEVQRLVELGILSCRRPMSGWPGPVVIQGGDYFGRTVNLAARIAARAGPGRVLVSQHVAESAPPDGVVFTDAGEVELKGFACPVRLLEARRA
jgi:hypothetical protein